MDCERLTWSFGCTTTPLPARSSVARAASEVAQALGVERKPLYARALALRAAMRDDAGKDDMGQDDAGA